MQKEVGLIESRTLQRRGSVFEAPRARTLSSAKVLEGLFAFLLAVAPLLFNYKGPFMNAGISVLILLFPFELLLILRRDVISPRILMLMMPLLLYWGFKIIDHGTDLYEISQIAIYIVLFFCFAALCVEPKLILKAMTFVACAACVLILIQYICYYLFSFHLQLVPTRLLTSGSSQWIQLVQTGRISVTGRRMAFYRPSAFFLEPSHMFVYLSVPLVYHVLSTDFGRTWKKAVLLSVGMLLSTSGMGILMTAVVWLLFLGKQGREDHRFSLNNYLKPGNLLILGGFLLLGLGLFFGTEFFRRSIMRIFSSGDDYRNAISGRLDSALEMFKSFSVKDWIIGVSDHYDDVEFHMTAFNATLYKYGLIGTILSYLFYIRCLFQLKQEYFWIAAMLIVASFFTPHTHGIIYMMDFVIILLAGYREQGRLGS
ncbi:MAG: hypothetical protein IJR95_00270 [Lachnospiraceae bacterium]|nr:hypothetical protein [Lachnospiraceae bacterium]